MKTRVRWSLSLSKGMASTCSPTFFLPFDKLRDQDHLDFATLFKIS